MKAWAVERIGFIVRWKDKNVLDFEGKERSTLESNDEEHPLAFYLICLSRRRGFGKLWNDQFSVSKFFLKVRVVFFMIWSYNSNMLTTVLIDKYQETIVRPFSESLQKNNAVLLKFYTEMFSIKILGDIINRSLSLLENVFIYLSIV